jgi:hypothetical protein
MNLHARLGWTIVLALAALPTAAQTLYKCRQADGRTVYQAEKCAQGVAESRIESERPRPPAATTPGPSPSAPGPAPRSPEPSPVLQAVGAYPACAQLVPGFGQRFGDAYRAMEQRNSESLKNLQAAPAIRQQIEQIGSGLREKARTPGGLDAVTRSCESMGSGLGSVSLR